MGLSFLKKFKDDVKKLDTVGIGLRTTELWLSTGNYALNRALSGDFKKGIPLSRISLMAGPSGSGKSFIAGNICLQAQQQDCYVVYLDSEHAIDVDYLAKIGVDVSEDKLLYLSVTTIEDVNQVLSAFFKNYIKENGKDNYEAQKVIIVLDSLAMLSSETEMENYDKGVVKGDQGQLAKRRKAMLRMAVGHLGRLPIGLLLTDHVYPQDIMLGDGAWAITNSTKFSSSIIGVVTKLKLKEEGEVTGVRMRFETYKSRFAKLGTKVELEVPYNKGMSPFSGLLDLLTDMELPFKDSTVPGKKQGWKVLELNGEDYFFRPGELTLEVVDKLLTHPLCKPILARNATPEDDVTEEDLDVIVDQDEAPETLVLPKGRKVKTK